MKRMEHKQQIIGTDGRMLGEQGKERQYTSRRSGGKEQREIDSPKRFLPAYAVDGGGCGQYKKEQGASSSWALPLTKSAALPLPFRNGILQSASSAATAHMSARTPPSARSL